MITSALGGVHYVMRRSNEGSTYNSNLVNGRAHSSSQLLKFYQSFLQESWGSKVCGSPLPCRLAALCLPLSCLSAAVPNPSKTVAFNWGCVEPAGAKLRTQFCKSQDEKGPYDKVGMGRLERDQNGRSTRFCPQQQVTVYASRYEKQPASNKWQHRRMTSCLAGREMGAWLLLSVGVGCT